MLKLLLKQLSRNQTNAFSFCSLSVLFSLPPPPPPPPHTPPPPGPLQGGVLTSRVTSLPCCFCNWLICLFWPGFSPHRQTLLTAILYVCYHRCWPQEWMQETFSLTLFWNEYHIRFLLLPSAVAINQSFVWRSLSFVWRSRSFVWRSLSFVWRNQSFMWQAGRHVRRSDQCFPGVVDHCYMPFVPSDFKWTGIVLQVVQSLNCSDVINWYKFIHQL